MIVHVTNVEWDTDENDIPSKNLPSEVNLEYDDLCISFLKDMADCCQYQAYKSQSLLHY